MFIFAWLPQLMHSHV